MKRTICIFLAMILALTMVIPALAADAPVFDDVPAGHWVRPYVERAFKAGVVQGTYYDAQTGKRLFSPDADISTCEWAVILGRCFYPDDVAMNPDNSTWYSRHMAVLTEHGIFEGVDDVQVKAPVTRYQMAQMMANLMKDLGVKTPSEAELSANDGLILDLAQVPSRQSAFATRWVLSRAWGIAVLLVIST